MLGADALDPSGIAPPKIHDTLGAPDAKVQRASNGVVQGVVRGLCGGCAGIFKDITPFGRIICTHLGYNSQEAVDWLREQLNP